MSEIEAPLHFYKEETPFKYPDQIPMAAAEDYELSLAALERPGPVTTAELDALSRVVGYDMRQVFLRDIAWAIAVFRHALPGWWFQLGLCALSGDASIGPDFRSEVAPLKEIIDKYDDGFHADLQPGNGLQRVARALLHCTVQARQAMFLEARDTAIALAAQDPPS